MKKNLEQSYTFARELTTLAILLIIFECIYIDRFVFDLLLAKNADPLNDDESPFKYHMISDSTYLLDGIGFLSFLLMHRSNLK